MLSQSFRKIVAAIALVVLATPATALNQLSTEQVHALYSELKTLQWIELSGGWPEVVTHEALDLGMVKPAVAALRSNLAMRGDLSPQHNYASGSLEAQTYDFELHAAIVRFQSRHGLEPDGILGEPTLSALNTPVETRIAQLETNLRRWEALAQQLDERYILVNIPEYKLRLFDGDRETMDMRVVVGSTRRPTPEMTESLEFLVVNPYWYVPKRISAYEILPKVQADPAYLDDKQYEVWKDGGRVDATNVLWSDVTPEAFDYSFRQKPGSGNSLGQVKFIMPNTSNIYLHDTPSREHFSRVRRAYSHGCVRLEEPFRLAKAVLGMQTGYSEEEIEQRLARDYTSRIELDEHLPVHIAYLTTWAQEGVVHYYPDVYRRDAAPAPAEPTVERYWADSDANPVSTPAAAVQTAPATPTASAPLVWSAVPAPRS